MCLILIAVYLLCVFNFFFSFCLESKNEAANCTGDVNSPWRFDKCNRFGIDMLYFALLLFRFFSTSLRDLMNIFSIGTTCTQIQWRQPKMKKKNIHRFHAALFVCESNSQQNTEYEKKIATLHRQQWHTRAQNCKCISMGNYLLRFGYIINYLSFSCCAISICGRHHGIPMYIQSQNHHILSMKTLEMHFTLNKDRKITQKKFMNFK